MSTKIRAHRTLIPNLRIYFKHILRESLKYLEGYARALTESDGICRDSDNTMTQTNTHTYGGPEYMCIMDRRDMRLLVKHIYFILYNPNKAKACFGDRGNVGWMYGVGGKLEESSSVAQWLRTKGRVNLDEFYEDVNQVNNHGDSDVGDKTACHQFRCSHPNFETLGSQRCRP